MVGSGRAEGQAVQREDQAAGRNGMGGRGDTEGLRDPEHNV